VNNVAKMMPLLEQAKKKHTRVVFASSVAVSGISPYGHTKRIGELMLQDYGLGHTSLRIHNVCGRDGEGVVDIIMDPTKDRFNRYGNNSRDFIHVDDVVRIIGMAVTSKLPKAIHEVGTGILTNITDLTEMVREIRPSLGVSLLPPKIGDLKTVEHKHSLVLPNEYLLYPTIKDILRSML
jgi:UDP-glucose 4-epimerase